MCQQCLKRVCWFAVHSTSEKDIFTDCFPPLWLAKWYTVERHIPSKCKKRLHCWDHGVICQLYIEYDTFLKCCTQMDWWLVQEGRQEQWWQDELQGSARFTEDDECGHERTPCSSSLHSECLTVRFMCFEQNKVIWALNIVFAFCNNFLNTSWGPI